MEPNPDISGIGVGGLLTEIPSPKELIVAKVIVGFVTTGWATLLLLAFHYVAVPSKASCESDALQSDQLDNTLRNMIWNSLKSWTPSRQWAPALEVVSVRPHKKPLHWYINST